MISIPALWATKTPSASKYEFTVIAFSFNDSGKTLMAVSFSATAISTEFLWLRLRTDDPPQAVAGTTKASTSSAQILWKFCLVTNCGARLNPTKTEDKNVYPSSSAA